MEFFKSTSAIGFMRGRKLAYLVSTVLFVVSIGALVFKGLKQPSGYTEPLLHAWRLKVKSAARSA